MKYLTINSSLAELKYSCVEQLKWCTSLNIIKSLPQAIIGRLGLQCCLDHQIVDLFLPTDFSLFSQLRASGISSVPKKQGIVIKNLAEYCLLHSYKRSRGIEEFRS